ncbi:hypothetical protein A7D27_07325 [Pseudomonas sp. 1D4]|nr:hypothetical protein A7D27_07325 [Pseudomonas sp. 1D4]OEC61970.1 hypothetical protein A9G05_00520 [Pseudomonas sp. ENNP23]
MHRIFGAQMEIPTDPVGGGLHSRLETLDIIALATLKCDVVLVARTVSAQFWFRLLRSPPL